MVEVLDICAGYLRDHLAAMLNIVLTDRGIMITPFSSTPVKTTYRSRQ